MTFEERAEVYKEYFESKKIFLDSPELGYYRHIAAEKRLDVMFADPLNRFDGFEKLSHSRRQPQLTRQLTDLIIDNSNDESVRLKKT